MDKIKRVVRLIRHFSPYSVKKVSQSKDLILLCLGQVQMTQPIRHRPLKLANCIISAVTKNCRTTVSHQNDSSDKKNKQEGQDGPGSLTRFFEIALAIFFLSFSEKNLQWFRYTKF